MGLGKYNQQWDMMTYNGIHWDAMEYNRIYWYELKEINWIYIYIYSSWNTLEYSEIRWNIMEQWDNGFEWHTVCVYIDILYIIYNTIII